MAKKQTKIDNRTPEEIDISRFLSFNNNLEFIPEPNRFFNIEDKVSIGALREAKIYKVLFEGKAYVIDYTSYKENYGNPILIPNCKGVWSWLDIVLENDNKESFIQNKDILLNYSQRCISSIFSNYYIFGLDMNPEYQRDYVWNEEDKVKLIDSIFNNIDIGKFVFIHKEYKENDTSYEIFDGKQRVRALLDFYEDKLLYNGLKYSELSNRDRSYFKEYNISYCEIKNCDLQQKLKVFYHINQFGKVMDQKHLDKIKNMIENS